MIRVVVGDVTAQACEALMRSVRSDLSPTTPGSRDVGDRAGAGVRDRLEQIGNVPIGGAVITPGGDLDVSFIIHVVIADEIQPPDTVAVQNAVRNGLRRAVEWGIRSLVLPPVGLGVGNMGAEGAARVLVELLMNHLDEGSPPGEVVIAVNNDYEESVFASVVDELAGERFSGRS
jgi:O-acetyl-ADP-ribose deacetylase (regulator of RNase III)